MKLRICHLYPDLLNLYGDRGNIIAIKKRAELRDIEVEIIPVSLGEPFPKDGIDFFFMGGGQDLEQSILMNDFLELKGNSIINKVKDGLPGLVICGGYQLMGKYYQLADGKRIEGLGIFDLYTIAGGKRLIGDVICECDFLPVENKSNLLIGFENHSGHSYLSETAKPLAKVVQGNGNNSLDRKEGCIYNNLYGTYMHGSLLPKNPKLTDYFIKLMLEWKGEGKYKFAEVDCSLEEEARKVILTRYGEG